MESTKKKWLIAILSSVTVLGLLASFSVLWLLPRLQPQPEKTALEPPRDYIIFNNREIPVAPGVDVNIYDPTLFQQDGQYLTYNHPEQQTFRGIDVSSHQETIDWTAVKNAGIEFAMLRVGYRGYTKGQLFIDNQFLHNVNHAEAVGMNIGIYFFSQAISVEEAEQEAETVLKWIRGYEINYPIVFDWEHMYEDDARTNDLTGELLSNCALAFCNVIYRAGYTPMIYFNQHLGYTYYDLNRISAYDFWLAEYSEIPTFFYHFEMLQYSNKGSIPGISGDVDLNISFVDYAAKTESEATV